MIHSTFHLQYLIIKAWNEIVHLSGLALKHMNETCRFVIWAWLSIYLLKKNNTLDIIPVILQVLMQYNGAGYTKNLGHLSDPPAGDFYFYLTCRISL
jgi:hypothetical protein